ncbi:hypothetical protein GJ744_011866 [Endocarpon pusillum]|uniref:Uncharacterized protein n=1 Tax=Endocarpon pusillum TaxID=364733 RepID=A0A8H7E315_9EURO|nr:hypothetical protein GJ744_011866 [Endocarpon pusillum]
MATSLSLVILSAFYGPKDVTTALQKLVDASTQSLTLTNKPGDYNKFFTDTWPGVQKSLSGVYQYTGSNPQAFVSAEASDPVSIHPSTTNVTTGTFPPPSGVSGVKILAIIYGRYVVGSHALYNNLYPIVKDGKTFNVGNGEVGADTWYGVVKTLAVYYTKDGVSGVQGRAGQEYKTIVF